MIPTCVSRHARLRAHARPFRSILRDPGEDIIIVRPLDHVRGLGNAPGQRLLMQRDVADVIEQ